MAARILALLIVMLVLIACGTDPGTSPTITGDANLTIEPTAAVEVEMPVETATPSTLPTPTPSPGPDPGRELIVSYLEAGLETPSDPTVFMDLLARIPDMDEVRDRLTLSDIAAMREIAGIATPARDAGLNALDTYIREVAQARKEGLPVVFPAWPAYMRDYLTSIVTFPYLGFDLRSIDQTVSAAILRTDSMWRWGGTTLRSLPMPWPTATAISRKSGSITESVTTPGERGYVAT